MARNIAIIRFRRPQKNFLLRYLPKEKIRIYIERRREIFESDILFWLKLLKNLTKKSTKFKLKKIKNTIKWFRPIPRFKNLKKATEYRILRK